MADAGGASVESGARERANASYHLAQDRMALLPGYYRWIARRIRPFLSGTVVDLGCGAGLVWDHALADVEQLVAVDHNPLVLDRLNQRLPAVRTVELDITGDWRALAGVEADVVVALDLLEHFADHRGLLTRMAGLLRPGGRLVLKVPAQPNLFSAADEASGHVRRYDREAIARLAAACGLTVVSLRSMNPVGALAYRFKGRRRTNFSRSLAPSTLALANLAMPVLSLLDHLPLAGLSLVGALEKTSSA